MRIAHVKATFPLHHAGTGIVYYHHALNLAPLGHEVTIFATGHGPPYCVEGCQ